ATLTFTGVSQATDTLFFLSHLANGDGTNAVGKDICCAGWGQQIVNGHGLTTGDGPFNLYFASGSGTSPAGVTITTTSTTTPTDYWAIVVDANTIKLASSRANALAGTAVNLTTNGSGTLSISESPAGTDQTHETNRQKNW